MKNYLIYFRNKRLEVTHRLYVVATNENNIVESAKRHLKLSDYYIHDWMDVGQSKKKGIPSISI